jgi:hypothetical protein
MAKSKEGLGESVVSYRHHKKKEKGKKKHRKEKGQS